MPHSRIAQRELADLLSVLAHPLRLALIFQLEEGERDVSALQEALDAPQSLVSQHLARLRALHLVEERREGRHVYYLSLIHI